MYMCVVHDVCSVQVYIIQHILLLLYICAINHQNYGLIFGGGLYMTTNV